MTRSCPQDEKADTAPFYTLAVCYDKDDKVENTRAERLHVLDSGDQHPELELTGLAISVADGIIEARQVGAGVHSSGKWGLFDDGRTVAYEEPLVIGQYDACLLVKGLENVNMLLKKEGITFEDAIMRVDLPDGGFVLQTDKDDVSATSKKWGMYSLRLMRGADGGLHVCPTGGQGLTIMRDELDKLEGASLAAFLRLSPQLAGLGPGIAAFELINIHECETAKLLGKKPNDLRDCARAYRYETMEELKMRVVVGAVKGGRPVRVFRGTAPNTAQQFCHWGTHYLTFGWIDFWERERCFYSLYWLMYPFALMHCHCAHSNLGITGEGLLVVLVTGCPDDVVRSRLWARAVLCISALALPSWSHAAQKCACSSSDARVARAGDGAVPRAAARRRQGRDDVCDARRAE